MSGSTLATAAGAAAVLIWTYLLFFRGHFWRVRGAPLPIDRRAELPAGIVAVVPARNEAGAVADCVRSLLAQGDLHLVLVDDASSDATAENARTAAGRDSSLTVLHGDRLPPGWTGKLWALHQGIERARTMSPRFLLLTDADVVHAPGSVAALAAMVEQGGYDLGSLMVRLHCASRAEKLLIPAFVFFFFKLYPPRWIADPVRATAGAAGGCMLIRPEALERAGGVAAIRGEIIDDCALARSVKCSGGRVWLGLAAETASLRQHGSLSAIGAMISRTAFRQLDHSLWLLLMTILGLALTYLTPPALLFTGKPLPMMLGGAAWAMMTIAYLPSVLYYRLNPLWAAVLPLAALFYLGATVNSAVNFWLGRGGAWKDRLQDVRREPSAAGR